MLLSLTVRNIALIDETSVDLYSGLHVLTGETGAGKSLIVDAMGLLLGGRADRELIRAGQDTAYVEGIFDLSDAPEALEALRKMDMAPEEGNEVILSRQLSASGRSVCRIGGLAVALQAYHSVTDHLMDLHGQHAHQSLMDDRNHLKFLDDFGPAAHQALLKDTAGRYRAWHTVSIALEEMLERSRQKQDREDVLKMQRKELKGAKLKRGEEEALEKERDRIRNGSRIVSAVRESYSALYEDASAVSRLRSAVDALRRIAPLGDDFSSLHERAQNAYYEVEDIALTLQGILDSLAPDPEREEQVMSRLDLIRRLSRRYGATTGDMLDRLEAIEEELRSLASLDGDIARLEDEEKKARKAYDEAADRLRASREALSGQFEKAVEAQLKDLNMAGTRFRCLLSPTQPSLSGGQACRFMISPNRGEELQSLSRTASGGELSRLMLAIKAAAADRSTIPSMVFDEIDTGISGQAAQVTAEKMAMIARTHQVLCVTHLQQIAAMADRQFLVEKSFDGERTLSRIRLLDADGRVKELSRMLGGDPASAAVHAAEMLKSSAEIRKKLLNSSKD
ncbi:MAG: DNA repair protein RecN [Clostridia bacterium]|nr:DNA repair protein RecN [Clostridia bacterium]